MPKQSEIKEYEILFRKDQYNESEFEAAKKIFGDSVKTNRSSISENKIVIGRYSVLPFYKELCDDLCTKSSLLINSYEQHRYIADMQNWYHDISEYTPKTWFKLEDVPINEPGSFILKGETNSKKFNWNTHMFAEDRSKAVSVMLNLFDDSLISTQNIYVRKFVPLNILYKHNMKNMPPASEEYRFFYLQW